MKVKFWCLIRSIIVLFVRTKRLTEEAIEGEHW